jgi:PDZ domain-containing protein
VVPREVIYPPDQTTQQVNQQDQQEMTQSQDSAQTAALRVLGYPVLVTVASVSSGSPAAGRLAVGDLVTSVDGQSIKSQSDLITLIQAKPPGSTIVIGYARAGHTATTTITTMAGGDGKAHIGIGVSQSQPHPFTVKISLAGVGGPSAGLMFSLGIVDKVESQDLTGGLRIAGTGTIDDDGNVGPIGGIAEKMRGARDDGATVFLVPAANCADAVHNAIAGLQLVKVATLDDALRALQALSEHETPATCTAS